MPTRPQLRIAALALLLALPSAVSAQVHVWKDAEGQTHYADVPPPGVESTEVNVNAPASTGTGSTSSKSLAEQEEEFRQRRTQRHEEAQKEADKGARTARVAAQCESARGQLAAIESGRRMVRYNSKGEAEFLTDEERKSHADDLRKLIKERCQ